jgi:hypothetical protein
MTTMNANEKIRVPVNHSAAMFTLVIQAATIGLSVLDRMDEFSVELKSMSGRTKEEVRKSFVGLITVTEDLRNIQPDLDPVKIILFLMDMGFDKDLYSAMNWAENEFAVSAKLAERVAFLAASTALSEEHFEQRYGSKAFGPDQQSDETPASPDQ